MRKVAVASMMVLYMVAMEAGTPAKATNPEPSPAKSLELSMQVVRQHPSDLAARRDLAKAMILCGQTVKAAEQMLLLVNAGAATADDWATLGEALRYSAKYPSAIEAYTRSLRMNPMGSDALAGLALAYAASGQRSRAVEILKTGLGQTADVKGHQALASTMASVQSTGMLAANTSGPIAR